MTLKVSGIIVLDARKVVFKNFSTFAIRTLTTRLIQHLTRAKPRIKIQDSSIFFLGQNSLIVKIFEYFPYVSCNIFLCLVLSVNALLKFARANFCHNYESIVMKMCIKFSDNLIQIPKNRTDFLSFYWFSFLFCFLSFFLYFCFLKHLSKNNYQSQCFKSIFRS